MERAPQDVVDRAVTIEVATDRCDARDCNAAAYVYAQYPTGSLAYCGHHGSAYLDRLRSTATKVIDLRHLIAT